MSDERLLQPGWPGLVTLTEAEYIAGRLAMDSLLRRQWRFRQRARYPLALIGERAFPEDPKAGRQYIESQMEGRAQRRKANAGADTVLHKAKAGVQAT